MFRALYTAASGMQAQQTNLDTIANNLANSSTAGFRSSRMQFQDLIYQNIVMPGAAASQQTTVAAGLQVGLGTRTSASEVLQIQGDLSATGNQLDLAIEGQGFFQVLLPTGELAYTRAGNFQTDAQGNVVTANGNPIQPALAIPQGATSITVASDGTVSVTLAGQTERPAGRQRPVGAVSESGWIEQPGHEPVYANDGLGRSRWSARPAARRVWDRSNKAISSSPM